MHFLIRVLGWGGILASSVLCLITPSQAHGAAISSVSDSTVDVAALTLTDAASYGRWINNRVFQQDILTSHGNRQYLAYYNEDRHVCLARRELPAGTWEIIEFTDYTMTSVDSHNVVSLGFATGDGTLHLAFDHHVDNLHYRKSVPGALDAATWDASLFGPVTNQLVPGSVVSGLTYPRFVQMPNGDLLFCYRTGYPGGGDRLIRHYDSSTGQWSGATTAVSRSGSFTDTYGSSSSRSGYVNTLGYGPGGRLHLTWVWREQAGGIGGAGDNHDLMYLYSDDDGNSWVTGNGTPIAGGGRVDTPGITAVSIPRGLGLANSSGQEVDSKGRVHVILRHCTDASLAEAGSYRGEVTFGAVAARRLFHYWRDVDNIWYRNELPILPGSRSAALVSDPDNNLLYAHLRANTLQILLATESNNWTDWAVIHSETFTSSADVLTDKNFWKSHGILSLPYQRTPATWSSPSTISVMDFLSDVQPVIVSDLYRHQVSVSEDAYVRNNGTQDGRGSSLFVKNVNNDSFDRITYLKFDTRKALAPVYGARLRAYVNTHSGAVTVSVFEVADDSWTEDGIAWENAPPIGQRVAMETLIPGESFYEWDVTLALLNKPDPIVSFALQVETSTYTDLTLRSREYGDGLFAPTLWIESATPYSIWAEGHHAEDSLLMPSADTNQDGVSNLVAFSMGMTSPLEIAPGPPIEWHNDGTSLAAFARQAEQAGLYDSRVEESSSLLQGSWVPREPDGRDVDFYGAGIDRLRYEIGNEKVFLRLRVEP